MAIWKKLANTTLGSAADTLNSGTFAVNKFLYYEAFYSYASGGNDPLLQFNGDTATNYGYQRSIDGGADTTNSNTSSVINNAIGQGMIYDQGYIINVAAKEKLAMIHSTYSTTTGAGTAPNRRQYWAKWANTSDAITSIQINMGSGNLDANSEITVYGSEGTEIPATVFYAIAGTIFEESDTGKHYMWDGTDTWNEVA